MKLRPRKNTPGRPKTRIPKSRTPSRRMSSTTLTSAEINALIQTAIATHEAALTVAGRLVPVFGSGGGAPPPVLYQYVTDPYKGDFNLAEKGEQFYLIKQQKP